MTILRGERIRGVSYASQVRRPDQQTEQALLSALNHDENVNVRLRAVDALENLAGNSAIQRALVDALPLQDSPLVQIAIIDVLTGSTTAPPHRHSTSLPTIPRSTTRYANGPRRSQEARGIGNETCHSTFAPDCADTRRRVPMTTGAWKIARPSTKPLKWPSGENVAKLISDQINGPIRITGGSGSEIQITVEKRMRAETNSDLRRRQERRQARDDAGRQLRQALRRRTAAS